MHYSYKFSKERKKNLLSNNETLIFDILKSLITGFWLLDNLWYAVTDNVIDFIYTIHPTIETLVVDLKKMSLSCKITLKVVSCVLSTILVTKHSRYLFIMFHVTINQLTHMVSCIQTEILIDSFGCQET